MDLQNFINDCTRTESTITEVQTNQAMLFNIAKIFLLSGQMLDQYKKNIFYKRDLKSDALVDSFRGMADAMTNISHQFKSASYQENNDILNVDPRILHAVIGMATESTELVEQLVTSLEKGTAPDAINLLEETFDSLWYSAILHDTLNVSMQHTMECGIEKLRKRYPEKFCSERAIERDLEAEREILSKMAK